MATTHPSSGSHTTSEGNPREERLLLVEDQADHADLIEVQLSAQASGRWTIERVATLKGAVAAAAATRPDVVLLDLNLPDSRGLGSGGAMAPVLAREGTHARSISVPHPPIATATAHPTA